MKLESWGAAEALPQNDIEQMAAAIERGQFDDVREMLKGDPTLARSPHVENAVSGALVAWVNEGDLSKIFSLVELFPDAANHPEFGIAIGYGILKGKLDDKQVRELIDLVPASERAEVLEKAGLPPEKIKTMLVERGNL